MSHNEIGTKLQLRTGLLVAMFLGVLLITALPADRHDALAQGTPAPGHDFEYSTRIRPDVLDDAELAKALDTAKAAGVTTLDYELGWEETDLGDSGGEKRTYDWSELDRLLEGAEARDMQISLLLTQTPDWVHPDLTQTESRGYVRELTAPKGDAELQHWSNFVHDVVERYKGKVTHYEIWNEPNLSFFWRPEPDPAEYAALLRAAYLSAKETDPEATIVFGGLSTNDLGYLNEYYEITKRSYPDAASSAYFFDVLGVHPYSADRSPDRYTKSAIHQGRFGGVDRNFLGFRRMKELMDNQEGSSKDLFLSEYGFSTTQTWMKAVPDFRRALYLKRAYDLARETPYVNGLSWYAYHPNNNDTPEWAMVDENLEPALTYKAYRQTTGAEASGVEIAISHQNTVSGTYTIEPQLTNLSGSDVRRWELYADGSWHVIQSSTPIEWDTGRTWDGRHKVMLAAYTEDGSVWPSNIATIETDNTPPALSITGGPDGRSFAAGSTQTWDFSAKDATSGLQGVQCSVVASGSPENFGPCGGGDGSHSVSDLTVGSYTFSVRARDNAGLETLKTRSFSINPDLRLWEALYRWFEERPVDGFLRAASS